MWLKTTSHPFSSTVLWVINNICVQECHKACKYIWTQLIALSDAFEHVIHWSTKMEGITYTRIETLKMNKCPKLQCLTSFWHSKKSYRLSSRRQWKVTLLHKQTSQSQKHTLRERKQILCISLRSTFKNHCLWIVKYHTDILLVGLRHQCWILKERCTV